MKRLNWVWWSILLFLLLILNGCGNSSNSHSEDDYFKGFKIEDIEFKLIGDGVEQSRLDNAQLNLTYASNDEERLFATSSQETLLSGLEIVGTAPADYSNRDNPIVVKQGEFYNINVLCKPAKAYKEKFTFNFSLLWDNNETTREAKNYSKVIATAYSKDINSTEAFNINVNTLIPTNLKAGRYALVVNIFEKENEIIVGSITEESIKDIPQFGLIYVQIEENSNARRIDLTSIEGSKYIDLPYLQKFVNGYSNIVAQKSSLVVYNSSYKDENITISGTLELENGEEVPLGLLDTNDGVIKDKINYSLLAYNENNSHDVHIEVSFYIPEDKYETLLNAIPDLSEESVEEAEATIIWHIKGKDNTLITNDLETTMLLSKFIDDFDSTENVGKGVPTKNSKQKKLEKIFVYIPKTQYVSFSKHNDSSQNGWEDITRIKNLTFKTIDGALEYSGDEAFLFHGDKYVVYNKNDHSVSEVKNIKDRWKGIPFNSIDAGLKISNDTAFLFSGNQYIKADYTGKIYSGYPKSINNGTWPGLSKLKEINAAVNYYNWKVYFFGKDSNGDSAYVRYDWGKDKVDDGYPKKVTKQTWNAIGETDVAGCFYDQYPQVICFKNKTSNSYAQNLINSGIFFKYDGEFKQSFGKRREVALSVGTEYSSVGRWDVPGINGKIDVDTTLYLYNHSFDILGISAESTIALNAKYTKDGSNTSNNKSRTGSSLNVRVLGSQIYHSYRIEEKKVDTQLSKDNSKKLMEEKKELSNNGKSFFSMPQYSWEEKRVLLKQRFSVGAIPFSIEMGIEGSLELNIALGLEGVGIKMDASAPINLLMYMEGGPDIKVLGAGIGGEANIIDTQGAVYVRSGLTLSNDGDLDFDLNAKAHLDLNILQGDVYLYAQTPWHKYTYDVYNSPWLYQRNWTLLDKNFILYRIELSN